MTLEEKILTENLRLLNCPETAIRLITQAPAMLAAREAERTASLKLLRLALLYLEHPDVAAIPFALSSEIVAQRIRGFIAELTEARQP